MIERAVRERWPSSDERRRELRQRIQDRALQTDNDRTLALLARVDSMMEAQNQRDELAASEPDTVVNLTVVQELRRTIEAMRDDPIVNEAIYDRIAGPYR